MSSRLVSTLRKTVFDDATETPYVCSQCGRQFEVEHYSCPVCGGYRVERTDWSAFSD
jgi:rRNA maturation endonuclease Nob1